MRFDLGSIRFHRFVSLLILVGQTWHWYREPSIRLRAHLPLFRSFPSRDKLYRCRHDVGLRTFQTSHLDSCFASPSCIDVQRAKGARDGWAEYSTTLLSRPIFHVHPRSLDMSTDKAARRVRFEGAWKVVKQVLFYYITGEGMPKDAIERYGRVSHLYWKTELSSL